MRITGCDLHGAHLGRPESIGDSQVGLADPLDERAAVEEGQRTGWR